MLFWPTSLIVVLSSYVTPGPYFERTVRTSSKSLNGRKIARMAPILTIFGPNRSRRRDLFFEKFSNERRRHRRLVVVSSSPSSSPPSSPSSPQHNYLRSQLLRAAVRSPFNIFNEQKRDSLLNLPCQATMSASTHRSYLSFPNAPMEDK